MPVPGIIAALGGAKGIATIGTSILGGFLGSRNAGKDRKLRERSMQLEQQMWRDRMNLDRDRFGLERGEYEAKQRRAAAAAPYQQQVLATLLGRLGMTMPQPGATPPFSPAPPAPLPPPGVQGTAPGPLPGAPAPATIPGMEQAPPEMQQRLLAILRALGLSPEGRR